jgi:hypothetical protein
MEKINRHNYEAWFLDYLEGNLGAEEKHDLLVFLEQNPDLKKELDLNLSEVSLSASEGSATVFENKQTLKVADDSLLTLNSVETWMLESVEGNLSASKQQELDDFVRKHQLEKTYTAYQSTILKADLNEVFEDRKKLKVATGIIIPMYMRVAAVAAAVALLIGVALNQPDGTASTTAQTGSGNGVMLASKTDAAEWARRMMHANDSLKKDEFNATPDPSNFSPNQDKNREKPDQSIIPVNLVNNDGSILKDSLKDKTNQMPEDDKIVDKQKNQQPQHKQEVDDKNDVAVQTDLQKHDGSIITEEPYKIVTNAASNVTKREVYFTRDKNTSTNEYVAYGFKIGGFEFERKK